MSTNTLSPESFTAEAPIPSVNPMDQLALNGETQMLMLSEGCGSTGERTLVKTEVPLSMLSAVQSAENGFLVGNEPADLLGVLFMGRQAIGIIDKHKERGQGYGYTEDTDRFMLASLDISKDKSGNDVFEVSTLPNGDTAAVMMKEPDTAHKLGREQAIIQAMGSSVAGDNYLSAAHAMVNFTESGNLHIVDTGSSNGTEILLRPKDSIINQQQNNLDLKNSNEVASEQKISDIRAIGGSAVHEVAAISWAAPEFKDRRPVMPEFKLGETAYSFKGVVDLIGNGGGFVFETIDSKGATRNFVVYHSNSEGGYRVSQGYETYEDSNGNEKTRLLKGGENDQYSQYTQDTQLNPEFEKRIQMLLTAKRDTLQKVEASTLFHNEDSAEKLINDFSDERKLYKLGSDNLLDALYKLGPGRLNVENVKAYIGLNQEATQTEVDTAILANINKVNTLLEQEGLVPDFTNPVRTETSLHPLLGVIKKEVFQKNVNGRIHEWVMASAPDGKVWIARVRLADTSCTAYGSDKEMLFSGVLTTKPLEYKSQTTGLPSTLKQNYDGWYDDITGFVDMLGPVINYRIARKMYRPR